VAGVDGGMIPSRGRRSCCWWWWQREKWRRGGHRESGRRCFDLNLGADSQEDEAHREKARDLCIWSGEIEIGMQL